MKQDDMNKQSYSNYVILMISSDGKQSNVFSISVLLVITILSGFRVTAIGLPSISLKNEVHLIKKVAGHKPASLQIY